MGKVHDFLEGFDEGGLGDFLLGMGVGGGGCFRDWLWFGALHII